MNMARDFPGYPEYGAHSEAARASAGQRRQIEFSRRDVIASYFVKSHPTIIVPFGQANLIYVPIENLFSFAKASGLNVGKRFLDEIVNQGTREPAGKELEKVHLGIDYFLRLLESKPRQTMDGKYVPNVMEHLRRYCAGL